MRGSAPLDGDRTASSPRPAVREESRRDLVPAPVRCRSGRDARGGRTAHRAVARRRTTAPRGPVTCAPSPPVPAPPPRLAPGPAARDGAAGTRERCRDVPVSPAQGGRTAPPSAAGSGANRHSRADDLPTPAETGADRPSRGPDDRTRVPPPSDSRVTKDSAGHAGPGQPKAVGSSGRNLAEGDRPPLGWGPGHLTPPDAGVHRPAGAPQRASPGQPQPGEAPHLRHAVPEMTASCDRYHRSRVTRDLERSPMRR